MESPYQAQKTRFVRNSESSLNFNNLNSNINFYPMSSFRNNFV